MFHRAQQLGVRFEFGAAVAEHNFETPAVTLADGRRFQGDLIVAADGKTLLYRDLQLEPSDFDTNRTLVEDPNELARSTKQADPNRRSCLPHRF